MFCRLVLHVFSFQPVLGNLTFASFGIELFLRLVPVDVCEAASQSPSSQTLDAARFPAIASTVPSSSDSLRPLT